MNTLVSMENVCKSYRDPSGEKRDVLDRINLKIPYGDKLAVVGPSGSGKTTLLNMLGALDRPDSGNIVIAGQCITDMPETDRTDFRMRSIGFVFQHHFLLPQCTALENVLLPVLARLPRGVPAESEKRGRQLLARVGLDGREQAFPGELSGGERQRVAVVRALITQPVLILADEPTGALDSATAAQLVDLLLELNTEEQIALVVVTHSLETAARMDRRFVLRQGILSAMDVGAGPGV